MCNVCNVMYCRQRLHIPKYIKIMLQPFVSNYSKRNNELWWSMLYTQVSIGICKNKILEVSTKVYSVKRTQVNWIP